MVRGSDNGGHDTSSVMSDELDFQDIPNGDHEPAGDFEDEEGGIQMGLLSNRPRNGKANPSSGSSGGANSRRELAMNILSETVPTLMATVVGMVFTGELLERISTWRALRELNELFILIPMLNNMKGNLEMNLSARLSTAANIGNLDDVSSRRTQIQGTLGLIQVQALSLSSLAAVASFVLGQLLPEPPEVPLDPSPTLRRTWLRRSSRRALESPRPVVRGPTRPSKLPQNKFNSGFPEFIAVMAVALSSASLSALILGSFMCSIILLCRRYRLNPDNISPPLASCLGDLMTLTLLSFLATFLTLPSLSSLHLPSIIALLCLAAFAFSSYITLRNPISRPLLKDWLSWVPLVSAMVISSGTGMLLDEFVTRWKDFGSLAVVISGLPASLGAVLISRLSTSLHSTSSSSSSSSKPSSKQEDDSDTLIASAVLLVIGLPVLLIYLIFMYATGWLQLPVLFLGIFVGGFAITSAISLYLANKLTRLLWSRGYDPDAYCLPIHSSIMELIGQCLLVGAYVLAASFGVDVTIAED